MHRIVEARTHSGIKRGIPGGGLDAQSGRWTCRYGFIDRAVRSGERVAAEVIQREAMTVA